MLADCELLIFDCDGVLVDSEPLAVEAFVDVLVRAGVPATAAMIEGCFGKKQSDILLSIAEKTGHDIPEDVPAALWPATRERFRTALRPMPGIAAFLADMPPVKRCVASSSHPERISFSLEVTGLADAFGDNIFSAHQVARGKPAPDLFLFAAANLDVDPKRCVVIEDSLFGVQAARAAGMTAIGFAGGGHIGPGHADELAHAGAALVETSWTGLGQRLLGR